MQLEKAETSNLLDGAHKMGVINCPLSQHFNKLMSNSLSLFPEPARNHELFFLCSYR